MFAEILKQQGIVGMVLGGSTTGKLILVILLMLSIISWAIVYQKYRQFRKLRQTNAVFSEEFEPDVRLQQIQKRAKELPESPLRQIYEKTYAEALGSVRRAKEKNIQKLMMPHITTRLRRVIERSIMDQSARMV